MNRSKYVSLTGISSILTSQLLPVSAQVAQPPVHVSFLPQQVVHSAIAQPQVQVQHPNTQNQTQSQPLGLHHGHDSASGASQSPSGTTPNNSSTQRSNQAPSFTAVQTATPTAHSGHGSHSTAATQAPSTSQTGSGLNFFHHFHHNNAANNQNSTPLGQHTQGQNQQPIQSPVSNATIAPPSHHLQWQNNVPGTGNNSINLDLGSSSQVATLGHQLNNISVTINVGGAQMQVTNSTQLTAAEKVAALQVMSTGQQTLVLDAKGAADGGSMTITPWLANHLGNLVIPSGVSVLDVSKVGSLTVHGSLTDSGNLYVASANPAATTVSLSASNLTINSGGLLSNVLPSGSTAAVNNPVNFNISSLNNITNAGTINSSGALVLNAGGAIVNAAQSGDAASAGIVRAVNDITITSGSGAITNGGLVESTTGNITLATASSSTNLNINGSGGTFQAEHGAINIQPASYAGSAQTNINGGNYLSQQLNLNGGAGAVNVSVDQVTGVVNATAGDVHFTAATPDLQLGSMNISGDPTYYNSTGSENLTAALNVTGDLAIVAAGDITSHFGITTTAGNGQAGNLTLIAGAEFTAVPTTAGPDSTTIITLSNANIESGFGGNVLVNSLSSGGDITVVAYQGFFPDGTINIPASVSTTGGNITMISGAASGVTAISTGSINTYGSGNAGNVALVNATPFINGPGSLTIVNGTVTGSYQTTYMNVNDAAISTGNILAVGSGGAPGVNGGLGGSVSINTEANITTGSIQTYGGGGGGGGSINSAGNGGTGGSVTLNSSFAAITVNGDINTSGGGGGGSASGGPQFSNPTGGSGGNVTITAPASTVTINGPILAASGGYGGISGLSIFGGAAGGGSFGGGGGAAFNNQSPQPGAGGGGGYSGGGGAGDGSNPALSAGAGGGISGGSGGVVGGEAGTAGSGGNGANAVSGPGTGGAFGQPGIGVTVSSPATAAGVLGQFPPAGDTTAGGIVTVTAGKEFLITQTVADLGAGFAGAYSNESIDARGPNGNITVTVGTSASNAYLANAKYDSGAPTYLAPTSGVSSKGDWTAGTVQVTTPQATFTGHNTVTAAQVSIGAVTETLMEGSSSVVIKPGDMVTPAEYIAFLQAASGGQSLTLNQTVVGTSPGTGYATGGNFSVAPANIPTGNFTSLVLPANVTENVTAPSLIYTGSGLVGGTINTTGTSLSFGTDLTLIGNGAINFNGATGGTLHATNSITANGSTLISVSNSAGILHLTTTNTGPAEGNIAVNTATSNLQISAAGVASIINNEAVSVLASTAGSNFGVETTSGNLTIAGDITSGDRLGVQTDEAGMSILEGSGTLYSSVGATFLNSTGDIGQSGHPILTNTPSIQVQTSGSVFVNDSISSNFVQDTTKTITSALVTETGAGQTLKIGDSTTPLGVIMSTGNFVATATGAGSSVVADNSITVSGPLAKIDLSTTGSGGITQTSGALTADTVVLSTGSVSVAGGSIGTIAVVAPNVTVGTNAMDTNSGSATITNTTAGASTIGTTSSVNNLTYTATGTLTSIGINAVDAKGGVTISDVSGTAGGIAINGVVNAAGTIALTAAGSGAISQGNAAASLNANTVNLSTAGGNGADIGSTATNGTIILSAATVDLGTYGGGAAYVQDAVSGSVTNSSGLASLVFTDLGSSLTADLYNTGNSTLQGSGQNNTSISNVTIQGSSTVTLTATGTGSVTGYVESYITDLNTTSGTVNISGFSTYLNLNIGGTGGSSITNYALAVLNGTVAGPLQFTTGTSETILGALQVGSGISTFSASQISLGTLTAAAGGSVQLTTTQPYNPGGITGGGTITADSVQLNTNQWDIGSSGSPINLVTHEFSATGNNIFLSNTGNAKVDNFTFSGTQAALSNVGTLNILGFTGTNTDSQDIRADIAASGAITINGPVAILASANSNSMLQFANTTTGGPLTVVNNAAVTASNETGTGGIIAFNGGATGAVSLTGTGTVNADTFVAFGNIDPLTLMPINGQVIPNTASFLNGNGLVSFSQSAPLGNQIIIAPFVPLPPTPPTPPVVVVIPTGGGGRASGGFGDFFFGVGGFGIPIPTTASNTLNQNNTANLANLQAQLAFAERLVQQLFFGFNSANPNLFPGNQFNNLNEQIGTRIATDYTPNLFPAVRKFPDLEGGIEITQKLSEVPGQAIFGVSEFNANELSMLANHGVQYGQNSKDQFLSLMKGFVLFAPDKDITVEVREGTVFIPKGCIAWVMETGADSAIYDLHDSLSTGAVRVTVNHKEIKMGPGTQLLLTRDMKSSFDQLNPGSSVGYRNIRSTDMGNGIRTFIADFSIAHGLENLEVLHTLFYSQEPKHRKLVAQMLKNAAILSSLTGGSEPFRTKVAH